MTGVIIVIAGATCLLGIGGLAIPFVRRDLIRFHLLSRTSVTLVATAYIGHGIASGIGLWLADWNIAFSSVLRWGLGGVCLAIGLAFYILGRTEFGSVKRVWGLRNDQLVSTGVYRFSRNPQCLGWFLAMLGASVVAGSGESMVLSGIFWIGCLIWVPLEERTLEEVFGDGYRQYRASVPRFIGRSHLTAP